MEQRERHLQGLILGFLALIATPLCAEQVGISGFKYLNNNDNSLTLDAEQASDLLNVDIRPGGKSVKKREGYGLYKDLGTSQGVHGGHHFFDSTGNDVQIWGSSTSLFGIVADGTPTQLVSSATLNSTWDCTDTQGYAYCVDSGRDVYLRTDGSSILWGTSPLGTMVDATPERVIVSGVSGSANSIYFSESGVFTNFTPGITETSPFTEVIASPGSKITHIRYGCGKILWWKDQSFGYLTGSNQFDLSNTIVSDTVGTFDNTSAIDPGGSVWFRGQDGHIWKYDCSALTKESIDITPLVQTSGKRTSNYWTQTTQSDFNSGAVTLSSPSLHLSTAAISGSITVSSFTFVETTSADFNTGTSSNVVSSSDRLLLEIRDSDFTNSSFESWSGACPDNFTCSGSIYKGVTSNAANACTVYVWSGNNYSGMSSGTGGNKITNVYARLRRESDDAIVSTTTFACPANCAGWSQKTVAVPSLQRESLSLEIANDKNTKSLRTNGYSIWSGTATFYLRCDDNVGTIIDNTAYIDLIQGGSSTITSGWYRSKTYDTLLSSSVFQTQYGSIISSGTPAFGVYTATSTFGTWALVTASSGTNSYINRYVFYTSTFSKTGFSQSASLTDVTGISRSTGTYYSAVHNAPNVTSWDTFSADQSLNDGTLTYYTRAALAPYTTLSATPTWVAQTNGGTVASSTGTYFQTRVDFGITAATQTPTLNDFTFNWYEGAASDQSYGTYFDNAIWFTVPYGSGQSTNNYIFKYDLINEGWTLYNFGTGGFASQNNKLYFGQVAGDNTFRYGGLTSDNGAAITAFWKSKDYPGSDPFLQNAYDQIDTLWTQNTGQSATVTYTLDTSSATAYTVNLSSPGYTIINHRKLLPGKLGYTANWKFGDESATSEWELLGFRFVFSPQPYRPSK